MRVGYILEAKGWAVETIPPDAFMDQAVHRLMGAGVGALIVTADGATVEGMLSERDVVRGLSRQGVRVLGLRVSDCMTRGGPTCTPDTLVQDAMGEMTRQRTRHLPVLAEGRLCGLISLGDVVKYRLDELELEANVLRDAYFIRG